MSAYSDPDRPLIYVDVYLRGLHIRRYCTDALTAVRWAGRWDGCKQGLVIITFRGKKLT